MITQDKLVPRFSLSNTKTPHGEVLIIVDYITNDLGYLSEVQDCFSVKTIYNPRYNWTIYFLERNGFQCQMTIFGKDDKFELLIEHLNEAPYTSFIELRDLGLLRLKNLL